MRQPAYLIKRDRRGSVVFVERLRVVSFRKLVNRIDYRTGLCQAVLWLHQKNPHWPASLIAGTLGTGAAYVRKTAARKGIKLASERGFR